MESLRKDESYAGGLMLYEGLVQARDGHISQMNTEPVCCYHICVPRDIRNTQKTHDE